MRTCALLLMSFTAPRTMTLLIPIEKMQNLLSSAPSTNWIIVLCRFMACDSPNPPCDYSGSSEPQLHPTTVDKTTLNTEKEIT